jgi:PHD/YefM family antitoxin component YafN of YafNO toxin-antitoxin module
VELSAKTIPVNLRDAIDRVVSEGERVVLTRKRKGVAALVSMDDLAALQRLEDEADLKAVHRARKEKGGITLDQYRKKHGL